MNANANISLTKLKTPTEAFQTSNLFEYNYLKTRGFDVNYTGSTDPWWDYLNR